MNAATSARPAPLVVLLFGAAIGLLVGMVCAVAAPVTRSAESTVFVSAQGIEAVPDLQRAAALSEQAADSFARVGTSPSVLEAVSRDRSLGLSTAQLAERVVVEREADSALLRVRATDVSAARAAAVANAVATRLSASAVQLQPSAPGAPSVHLTIVQRATAAAASTGSGLLTRVLAGLLGGIGVGATVLLVTWFRQRRPPTARGAAAAAAL